MEGKEFRIQGTRFLLTYSRCNNTKEDMIARISLLNVCKNHDLTDWFLVQESHMSNNGMDKHIHCVLKFNKSFDCRNQRAFDVGVWHANIQKITSVDHLKEYLAKEDPSPLYSPDFNWDRLTAKLEGAKNSNKGKYQERNELILNKGLRRCIEDGDINIENASKIETSVRLYQNKENWVTPVESMTIKIPIQFQPEEFYEYHVQLEKNHRNHLWLCGGPGTGKTYCSEHQEYRFYKVKNIEFMDGYQGEQLIIIPELKPGSIQTRTLIDFMEAERWDVKYGSVDLPNRLIIVTSNFLPQDVFEHESDAHKEAILSRFQPIVMVEKYPTFQGVRNPIILDKKFKKQYLENREEEIEAASTLASLMEEDQPRKRQRTSDDLETLDNN